MREEITTLYVTDDGQKFKSKSAALFHEEELKNTKVYDKWLVPQLSVDEKYGDLETAYAGIKDCVEHIEKNLTSDNVDEVKMVLRELAKRLED